MATSTKRMTSKSKSSSKKLTPSQISFKSAATVKKRTKFINSLNTTKAEIATYLLKNSLEDTYKKYSTKKGMVTSVVNEANAGKIYFKSLKTASATTSKSSSRSTRSKSRK